MRMLFKTCTFVLVEDDCSDGEACRGETVCDAEAMNECRYIGKSTSNLVFPLRNLS